MSEFIVSNELSNTRYAICKSCDQFNLAIQTCKICHCFMPMKVRFGYVKCPDGKWGTVPEGDK